MRKKITLRKMKHNLNYLFSGFFASSAVADPLIWSNFLHELENLSDKNKKIELFVNEYKNQFPIIQDDKVVFVHRGKAKRVFVAGDFNNWQPNAVMKKINNTDIHYLTLKFPSNSRLEYKYVVDGKWMLDPLNKKTAMGGFGENSDLHMPDYQVIKWFDNPDSSQNNNLHEYHISSKILKNKRKLTIYLPEKYDKNTTYPLIIVHDGSDYIRMARLINLLHSKFWKTPIIIAFVDPVNRNEEYGCSPGYKNFTKEELLPFIEDKFSISPNREDRIFAGASMGGIVSFFLAYELRDIFGGAICQSGAFIFPHMLATMKVDKRIKNFLKKLKYHELRKLKLWIDCGTIGPLEQFLLQGNRFLHENLAQKEIDHMYVEANEAHNWRNWAKQIEKAMKYMIK